MAVGEEGVGSKQLTDAEVRALEVSLKNPKTDEEGIMSGLDKSKSVHEKAEGSVLE
jgi:hypothetical protein